MRIPITMCHGINGGDYPLTVEHLDLLTGIARAMGFESIDYDRLEAWRQGGDLPGIVGFPIPRYDAQTGTWQTQKASASG